MRNAAAALAGLALILGATDVTAQPTAARTPRGVQLVSWREIRTNGQVDEIATRGPLLAANYTYRDGRGNLCYRVLGWGPSRTRVVNLAPACWGYTELWIRGTRAYWHFGGECHNDGCEPRTDQSADFRRPGVVRREPQRDPPEGKYQSTPNGYRITRRGVVFDYDDFENDVVTLRRLSDGRTRRINPPGGIEDAEFENEGLYFAYNRPQRPYQGRIVFVPFNELFPR